MERRGGEGGPASSLETAVSSIYPLTPTSLRPRKDEQLVWIGWRLEAGGLQLLHPTLTHYSRSGHVGEQKSSRCPTPLGTVLSGAQGRGYVSSRSKRNLQAARQGR
jgi:hypothetical protein